MAGRGELPCSRCKELKRKDKLVHFVELSTINDKVWLCKHCRAVMVMRLRHLEEIALLAD